MYLLPKQIPEHFNLVYNFFTEHTFIFVFVLLIASVLYIIRVECFEKDTLVVGSFDYMSLFTIYLTCWLTLAFLFFYGKNDLIYLTVFLIAFWTRGLLPFLVDAPTKKLTWKEKFHILWNPHDYIELSLFWSENYLKRLTDSKVKETLIFLVFCLMSFYTALSSRFKPLLYLFCMKVLLSGSLLVFLVYSTPLVLLTLISSSKPFISYVYKHYGATALKRLGFNSPSKQFFTINKGYLAVGAGIGLSILACDTFDIGRSKAIVQIARIEFQEEVDFRTAIDKKYSGNSNYKPSAPLQTADLPRERDFRFGGPKSTGAPTMAVINETVAKLARSKKKP